MDKEVNRESPSLLPNSNTTIKEESPRKLFGGAGVVTGGGGDRLKRDEWSEGAVSTLLEAYENKWILRNRAKLKGNDWEDVAHHVSSRANSTKSPKTQTQCKNKIESMKKRYRSESSTADVSSWPLYPRLDLLLRGNSAAAAVTPPPQVLPQHQQPAIPTSANPPLMLLMDRSPLAVTQPPAPPMAPPHPPPPHHHQTIRAAQNSHGSNGVDKGAKGDGMDAKLSDHVSDKNSMDTDSSTPAALYSDKEEPRSKKLKKKTEKRKRRKREEWEMADSIRWLAEVVVRSEQARMETMRELEKMRIEAEAKRGEMDLKRTEIIANTQLEIAKLFAGAGRAADSSVRIGKT
ncbi:SEQUENCE-SPECIFIC DNA BINDING TRANSCRIPTION FACTOR [Salix koriyanagi]|uniref:SEQUENCE-SPECIFIC DNA BINDING TRANSCRIPTION FACTOR n=1 Tax=Salix koriyanagi TaxID=2511006 RepID=A0A9Q0PUZ5_9ROSI|nr:SEQUENCE-SPECIFIC DNA BINDING TRANSCRIPTION FACTOR [Salix koriyanagi]